MKRILNNRDADSNRDTDSVDSEVEPEEEPQDHDNVMSESDEGEKKWVCFVLYLQNVVTRLIPSIFRFWYLPNYAKHGASQLSRRFYFLYIWSYILLTVNMCEKTNENPTRTKRRRESLSSLTDIDTNAEAEPPHPRKKQMFVVEVHY